jgi:hypothetical protein
MLDPLQQAFETEMKAKTTARPRPAATRRAEQVDNSSAPGAAELGRRIQAFGLMPGSISGSRSSTPAVRASRRFGACAPT